MSTRRRGSPGSGKFLTENAFTEIVMAEGRRPIQRFFCVDIFSIYAILLSIAQRANSVRFFKLVLLSILETWLSIVR